MTVNNSDIISIPISKDMDIVATYLANKRVLFEYPREGYGNYNTRGIDNFEVMDIRFSAILKATSSPSIAHGPAINRNLSLDILSVIIFTFF